MFPVGPVPDEGIPIIDPGGCCKSLGKWLVILRTDTRPTTVRWTVERASIFWYALWRDADEAFNPNDIRGKN